MLPTSPDRGRPALLLVTVKAVVAIGALSVLATHWLASSTLDRASLTRLAANVLREPSTTGSIVKAAGNQKLDPCVVPRQP